MAHCLVCDAILRTRIPYVLQQGIPFDTLLFTLSHPAALWQRAHPAHSHPHRLHTLHGASSTALCTGHATVAVVHNRRPDTHCIGERHRVEVRGVMVADGEMRLKVHYRSP